MATITEDYISFGTAKALKEKGFDIPCDYAYNNKAGYFEVDRSNFDEVYCFRPSLAMAMKWLREVHNLQIQIAPITSRHKDWAFGIYKEFSPLTTELLSLPTYEEAVEAAIKYCLENLI